MSYYFQDFTLFSTFHFDSPEIIVITSPFFKRTNFHLFNCDIGLQENAVESSTYYSVSSHLIHFIRNRRWSSVNMDISPCCSVFDPNQIAVTNKVDRISSIPQRRRLVVSFNEPSVVWISDVDCCDLLLSSTNRIQLSM